MVIIIMGFLLKKYHNNTNLEHNEKINDDEIELLTDDELLLVLNLCLLNGFSIKYLRG